MLEIYKSHNLNQISDRDVLMYYLHEIIHLCTVHIEGFTFTEVEIVKVGLLSNCLDKMPSVFCPGC